MGARRSEDLDVEAHLANWIFVLARTDPSAPPHRGISFLLVPLDQPGIEIRPIPMMSGQTEFNEVFFDGARTDVANVVGPVDGVRVEVMRFLGLRIMTDYLRDGTLGSEASVSKLYWSEYHRRVTSLALDILGPNAQVPEGRMPPRAYRTDDPGAPNSTNSWIGAFYNSIAGTIYVGTSQVQRNILGETVLGLPREPRP